MLRDLTASAVLRLQITYSLKATFTHTSFKDGAPRSMSIT